MSLPDANLWDCRRGERGRFTTTTGRPLGSRNKKSQIAVQAISDLGELAFSKLQELLEAGNPETVRFVISNLIPSGGRAVQLDDLSAQGLMEAVASGTISPAELRSLAAGIEKIRNVESLDKLAERLAEVERLLKDGSI